MQTTAPRLARAACHWLSIDEHAIARFTHKFCIPQGFHTIRNKKMRLEKLTFVFDVAGCVLHASVASPDDVSLAHLAKQLLAQMRRCARGATLRVSLDAVAAHSHDEFLDLVPASGKSLSSGYPDVPLTGLRGTLSRPRLGRTLTNPGPYLDALSKSIAIAETRTAIQVTHYTFVCAHHRHLRNRLPRQAQVACPLGLRPRRHPGLRAGS